MAKATGITLPEHEAYDTIAGLLVKELGKIPQRGDKVNIALPVEPSDDDEDQPNDYAVLRVEHMDGLRVDRITIKRVEGDLG